MSNNAITSVAHPSSRRWLHFRLPTLLLFTAIVGVVAGWVSRELRITRAKQDALLANYADRATICTEALARLRVGDTAGAITYLEEQADRALHGVPNWRSYRDLPEAGQVALSQAKVYRSAYPTKDQAVNWYLRDVPLSTDQMSDSLKKVAAKPTHCE
jgi:hypothetical protein